jgi:phage shock protein C
VNPRRLYRCREDRKIAGVAAGMAEYLEMDPTMIRVLWILSAFFGGFTIALYVILAFVMPIEPLVPAGMPEAQAPEGEAPAGSPTAPAAEVSPVARPALAHAHAAGTSTRAGATERQPGQTGLIIGVLLVVFGTLALAGEILPGIAHAALGPAFLLALGVALVIGATRRPAPQS